MGGPIILLLIGVFAIICTLLKPPFYWESKKALRLRRLVGDRIATLLYLVIGIFCIVVSIGSFIKTL